MPSTIHLIAKYEQDLKQALVENIMAGGDSSARGMLTGFIIGAYQGLAQIPQSWLDDMQAYKKIEYLINT
ncbi:MAG: ADP-ribosylglycohydrolase family protein [Pseudomonadota bacterium]